MVWLFTRQSAADPQACACVRHPCFFMRSCVALLHRSAFFSYLVDLVLDETVEVRQGSNFACPDLLPRKARSGDRIQTPSLTNLNTNPLHVTCDTTKPRK